MAAVAGIKGFREALQIRGQGEKRREGGDARLEG